MLGAEYDVSTGRAKVYIKVGKAGPNGQDLGQVGGKKLTWSIALLSVTHSMAFVSSGPYDNQERQMA